MDGIAVVDYEARMGAWGPGSFENDSALDWLADLVEGGADVREVLASAVEPDAYLDVDDASAAVAAAEIVAAGKGRPHARLPGKARAWLTTHRGALPEVKLAREAVARVLAASELQELWGEGETDGEWRAAMRDLEHRLTG